MPLWHQLRHLDSSYAILTPVTPLVLQLRHFNISYATSTSVTPLILQLRHFYASYPTLTSVTPLLGQLRHFNTSYATLISVTPLLHQLRHFNSSYATFISVTPLVPVPDKAVQCPAAILDSWYSTCTQRNLFRMLLNQTQIRLYLPFSDLFGTKQTFVWFQINKRMVNTIWFQFVIIGFQKDFSVRQNSAPKLTRWD